jgi:hypothetical protein
MNTEDQYLDRTPDLVAKVRAMREVADKEMDHFTRVADYDVRRVVGQGSKPSQLSSTETARPSRADERPNKHIAKSPPAQALIEFAPAPAERTDREKTHEA